MTIEILRRIVLAAGVVAGATLICYSPPYLYSAKPVDWNDKRGDTLEREQDNKRLMGNELPGEDLKGVDLAPHAKSDLQTYINRETKDRLYEPTSKEWTGVFAALASLRHGKPPSPEWEARNGREWDDEWFFSDLDAPFGELQNVLKGENHFTNILVRDGNSNQYLAVTKRMRQDSMRYAPGSMAYPLRRYGFACLLAAALLYWLLPWPKVRQESLRYSRARSATVPDIMAAFMVGMFYCLPILVTSSNSFGEGIFSPGWIILTCVMWFFCLLFGSIWVFSTGYTSFSLEFLDSQLRLSSWRGTEMFAYSDIEAVTVKRIDPKKLNRALVWIALLVNWRAAGPALVNSGPEYAVCLRRRDGRLHRFPLKGLLGAEQAVGRLMQSGVTIEPEVFELLGIEPTSKELSTPFPPLGKGIGAFIAGLVFLALFGWLAYVSPTTSPLKIEAAPLPTEPYTEPKDTTWVPSADLMKAEEDGLAEIKSIQARMKELEQIEKTGTEEQRKAAVKESEELLQKATTIYENIDKMRKEAGATD